MRYSGGMTNSLEVPGRRERKKAQARRSIADAALRLFLERGYDAVSAREVAEAADVSVSGLWKHFSCKEALVLDREQEAQEALVARVRELPPGAPLLPAVRSYLTSLARHDDPTWREQRAPVWALVSSTPALRAHSELMWRRQETALADAILARLPQVPDAPLGAAALARFVLDASAHQPGATDELDAAFTVLEEGWRPGRTLHGGTEQIEPAPHEEPTEQGLRERKKLRTRRAITDTAVTLFLERGYEQTGIRDVAEAADVSVSTLFAYFPGGKASLVFDGDAAERVATLAAAVRDRAEAQSALQAVTGVLLQRGPFAVDLEPRTQRALDLVMATPELRDYARGIWLRSQPMLAAALAQAADLPPDDKTALVTARWLLQVPDLALATAAPRDAVPVVVELLESGWPAWLAARRGAAGLADAPAPASPPLVRSADGDT